MAPAAQQNTNTELGNDPAPQLYDLSKDAGERNNLAASRPEKVSELAAILERIRTGGAQPPVANRPNIVLAIADDWSFPHASIYGDRTVRTPNFDRIAREGARFTHAFAAAPSCTPSRAALLTGQAVHRLEEGGNLWGSCPRRYAVYPDLLEQARLRRRIHRQRLGPGPRSSPAAGPATRPARCSRASTTSCSGAQTEAPFCFWFGSSDPHRPYERAPARRAVSRRPRRRCRSSSPIRQEVRSDLLDYYFEVQRFDRDLGADPRDARTRRRARQHDRSS